MLHGWINFYKPKGYTSRFCINLIQKKFKIKKIGYTGTLDPMAEGILPLAINEATKSIPFLHNFKKTYIFEMKWGEETDTLDTEGKIINKIDILPTRVQIQKKIKEFKGKILQTPPKFSAKKFSGERAYNLARKNIDFDLKAVPVEIYSLRLLKHDEKNWKSTFICKCSRGTYIRSLARDISKALGSLAYCTKIERVEEGCFKKKTSINLENLNKLKEINDLKKYLLDIQTVLYHIPRINFEYENIRSIKNGMKVNIQEKVSPKKNQNIIALFDEKVLAFGISKNGYFYPQKVLNY